MKNEFLKILIEEIDEEILEKMPEWFIILRRIAQKRLLDLYLFVQHNFNRLFSKELTKDGRT